MCDGCKVKDDPTDFGAFVHAFTYAAKKPELRKKVVRKARKLFLIETGKGKKEAAAENQKTLENEDGIH